jgi:hypothetical protein
MKEIRTSVDIDAPADRVWTLLVDTGRWHEWNPFASGVDGKLEVGQKVVVHMTSGPGGRAMKIKPDVTVVVPGSELRWVGGLLHPTIMRGEHYFRVEPLEDGRSRFVHGEVFSGVLITLIGRLLLRGEPNYQAMNDALKARAESDGA